MDIEIEQSADNINIDYKEMLKVTLNKILDIVQDTNHPQAENLNNLALSAIDYAFYLEDNTKIR